MIDTNYGFSLPVPLVTLGIGISSNNINSGWNSTWVLHILDEKNLPLGDGDYQESN